uniref:Uncharacterized protein n=1 Tax=Physcomitrium patens TaxID=3218 RepID=A0A2K1KW79_PHYPA|nr:hypothetical protein PHYPA_005028 [Physcomitrium patens]
MSAADGCAARLMGEGRRGWKIERRMARSMGTARSMEMARIMGMARSMRMASSMGMARSVGFGLDCERASDRWRGRGKGASQGKKRTAATSPLLPSRSSKTSAAPPSLQSPPPPPPPRHRRRRRSWPGVPPSSCLRVPACRYAPARLSHNSGGYRMRFFVGHRTGYITPVFKFSGYGNVPFVAAFNGESFSRQW